MHKCTEFDFGCGSTPDPTERAYSATLDPVAGFNGPTFKGLLSKYAKLIILKNLAMHKRTPGPDLP